MQGRNAALFIMHQTAIVILNWNGRGFLEKFLPPVIATCRHLARIIVADNASTDESVALIKERFPEVELILLDKNYGFTGGYNRALRQVDARYFVLLNSDVEVTEGWLDPLVTFMEQFPNVAACQPKIRSFSDRQLFEHAGACGGFIDYLGYPFCRGRIYNTLEEDKGQYEQPMQVFWATGACLMIRSSSFLEAEGFDERFFAHMEEIDLCWRLQQSGKEIFVLPSSIVYHVGGGTLPKSNPRKTYFNFRNNLMMLFKNLPGHRLIWLIPVRLILDGLAGIKFFFDGDRMDTWAVVKAHFAFYRFVLTHAGARIHRQRRVKVHPSKGIYHKSIAVEYYLGRKKYFRDLDPDKFS